MLREPLRPARELDIPDRNTRVFDGNFSARL